MKDTWNPTQYDRFKSERSQPFHDLMNLVQRTADLRVVDLGCGSGELTALLHQHLHARQTVGIDSSGEMLRPAAIQNISGLTFENQTIEKWSPSEKYDLIFSNAALQWCRSHAELFKRLKDQLALGGQFAFQMPMNHDYPTHVLAAQMSLESRWNQELKGQAYNKASSMLSPEDYATLLFKLGFKEQRIFVNVYGHVLGSRDEVIEWVKGTLLTHFSSRLEPAQYELFLAEYKERLFKILKDDRPFFYPFKRVFIWGRI